MVGKTLFGSTCLMPATEARVSALLVDQGGSRRRRSPSPTSRSAADYSPTGNAPLTKANIGKFTPEW